MMLYLYFSLCFYIPYPYFSLCSTTSILRILTGRGKLQFLKTHVDFTDCTCRFCFSIQNRKDRLHQRLRRWKYYKEQKIRLFKISIYLASYFWLSFPGGLESNAGDLGWIAGLGISPGERNGKPTPAFLLGESHGQRNLAASPWGRKESDTTERLTHTHFWLFWASVAVWAFSSSWECGLLCIVAVNRLFIGVASLVPGHRR